MIGYVQIPTGLVGPLTLDNEPVYIPMATTEGCLVASTQRGAKAISEGGGAASVVVKDGITRAPAMLLLLAILRVPPAMFRPCLAGRRAPLRRLPRRRARRARRSLA